MGAGSKVPAAENLANLFPRSELIYCDTTKWFSVFFSEVDIHAQARKKTPVDRPLRKPCIDSNNSKPAKVESCGDT